MSNCAGDKPEPAIFSMHAGEQSQVLAVRNLTEPFPISTGASHRCANSASVSGSSGSPGDRSHFRVGHRSNAFQNPRGEAAYLPRYLLRENAAQWASYGWCHPPRFRIGKIHSLAEYPQIVCCDLAFWLLGVDGPVIRHLEFPVLLTSSRLTRRDDSE
jgi:hypothetical protein